MIVSQCSYPSSKPSTYILVLLHAITVRGYSKANQINFHFLDDFLHTISCIMYMAHLSLVTCWRHTPQSRSINISSSVSSVSSSSTSMSNSLFSTLNVAHNLSFVHYNVQSILTKLDTLYAELYEFDILAFTETWLNPAVDPTDLLLDSYCEPERKDRPGDSHGGIMIYIKEGIHYKRREDLEPRNVECIWLELNLLSLLG